MRVAWIESIAAAGFAIEEQARPQAARGCLDGGRGGGTGRAGAQVARAHQRRHHDRTRRAVDGVTARQRQRPVGPNRRGGAQPIGQRARDDGVARPVADGDHRARELQRIAGAGQLLQRRADERRPARGLGAAFGARRAVEPLQARRYGRSPRRAILRSHGRGARSKRRRRTTVAARPPSRAARAPARKHRDRPSCERPDRLATSAAMARARTASGIALAAAHDRPGPDAAADLQRVGDGAHTVQVLRLHRLQHRLQRRRRTTLEHQAARLGRRRAVGGGRRQSQRRRPNRPISRRRSSSARRQGGSPIHDEPHRARRPPPTRSRRGSRSRPRSRPRRPWRRPSRRPAPRARAPPAHGLPAPPRPRRRRAARPRARDRCGCEARSRRRPGRRRSTPRRCAPPPTAATPPARRAR